MLGRYLLSGQAKFLQSQVGANNETGSTGTTQTWQTDYTGEPGAVLGMKVTSYSHSSGSAVYKVNGSTYILNDTFNITLDGSGNASVTQFIDVGTSTPPAGIAVTLTIMTTTIGTVAPVGNQTTLSKTI